MTREELEHIIRASGNITQQYEFVILGSQSILGAVPSAWTRRRPELRLPRPARGLDTVENLVTLAERPFI